MGEKKLRLFVAVPIPDEVREEAAAVARRLESRAVHAGWDASFVPPANFHLTLKFLGWVVPSAVDSIVKTLEPITAHPPFPIELGGVGAFPPRGRPRVVWIGVGRGADDLASLAAEVEGRLETLGFSREDRPYHAHLTLARAKRTRGRPDDVIDPFGDAPVGTFTASKVVLYQSRLRQPSPEYIPLVGLPLSGVAASSPPG